MLLHLRRNMRVFNEDTRVKIPAVIQFMRLGYEYQSLKDIDIDTETRIALNRFKPAIEKINGIELSDDELVSLINDIHSVIRNNDMGKEFYSWLTDPQGRVKLIDFDNPDNNDFAVVAELFYGPQEKGSFRPDVNILINGIPLAFLEVKKPNNPGGIQAEFRRMLDDRLLVPEFRKYFNMLQIISFSNNMEYETEDDAVSQDNIKAGSFYTTPNGQKTTFSFFREEQPKKDGFKDITRDTIEYVLKDNGYSPSVYSTPEFQTNLDLYTPCNAFVSSLFERSRILYFLKYGLVYVNGKVPEKHIMRYPQYFASKALLKRLESGGKSGIIFHTQGSGKTELVAYGTRILRDYYAKKEVTARFYYVVDRLDLLTQVSNEMTNRGLNVINVDNKKDFEKELNKTLSTSIVSTTNGELTVVNIQKFDDDMPVAKNEYNAKIQRIFFIDEAHRSYKMAGEFFKNLMLVDDNAVYVAMTGTPLLSKKERSNLKFGDYIHKYFYDKSIADGYTLRIKKEQIETKVRDTIKANLELDNPSASPRVILESPAYISDLGRFIDQDFKFFRLTNSDPTIGGMVVCCSNSQAKKVKAWFDENSDLETGLVITDESITSAENRNTQLSFKNTLKPDLLIVNQMLTTGYDVARLKKMYLMRNAKEHNLLQTISRVNRPYRSPTGKYYEYGYIVDFVDIQEEYDRTIDAYLKELAEDFNKDGDEGGGLTGLIIGPDDINDKYKKYKKELDKYVDTSNVEAFATVITLFTKEALYAIRRLLNGIKTCHTEFALSHADDYIKQIDIDKIKRLISEVTNRISFLNLSSTPIDLMSIISNEEVCKIIYEFFKTQVSLMDEKLFEGTKDFKGMPGYEVLTDTIVKIQDEIKKNKNHDQSQVVKLNELLQKIFEALNIQDLDLINGKLADILAEIKRINEENEKLAERYEGNYSFVKTLIDAAEVHPDLEKDDLADAIDVIYAAVSEIKDKKLLVIQGKDAFTSSIKKATTPVLLKNGLYKKLKLKDWYTDLLNETYNNMKLF